MHSVQQYILLDRPSEYVGLEHIYKHKEEKCCMDVTFVMIDQVNHLTLLRT